MTRNDSASASALNVMKHHLEALNALNESDLADTLHFPHYRLAGNKLDCWLSKDQYLSDFRRRAGKDWARTAWKSITIQKESSVKVHLLVNINRFDKNETLIADFESLWVITLQKGKMGRPVPVQFCDSMKIVF